jgi:hypothetical protein
VTRLVATIRNNPAVILGLVGGVVVAAGQYTHGGWAAVDWYALAPLVVGAVTRFTVYGPNTFASAVDAATRAASAVDPRLAPILAAVDAAAQDAADQAVANAVAAVIAVPAPPVPLTSAVLAAGGLGVVEPPPGPGGV